MPWFDYISLKLVKLPIEEGISPANLLLLKSLKNYKRVSWSKDLYLYIKTKFVSFPMDEGIGPQWILLLKSLNDLLEWDIKQATHHTLQSSWLNIQSMVKFQMIH